MELIKAIIALVTSFFQNKTVTTVKEVKLADAQTAAVVETIRASENAVAVQQNIKTQEALEVLDIKQKKERDDAKKDPEVNADQFTKDW